MSTEKEQIVELLNQAALANDATEKITCLTRTQDLILHFGPELVDSFLDEVLAFQNDRSQEVRKTIVGFLEEACKKDPDVFPKVAVNFSFLLRDEAVLVQKRVITALTHLYPIVLRWVCRARSISKDMSSAWDWTTKMKKEIIKWLDHDNDGVRTITIKFFEMLIIAQTYREEDSTTKQTDVSLDIVPVTLTIARPRKLEEEAKKMFEELVKYHSSAHISAANLLACMGSLSLVARARPFFMGQVINALEMLHANLPPTLTKSQVSSVRKHLKLQLLNLLKHPASSDHVTNITTLLTDLGATQSEVDKSLPKPSDVQKRKLRTPATPKRIKPDYDDDDYEEPKPKSKKAEDPIDYTQNFVKERLSVRVTTELVMSAMAFLPHELPPQFSSTFTPIAAAGTEGQIMHLARLLATQLTAAGLGMKKPKPEKELSNWEEDDDDPRSNKSMIGSVLGSMISVEGQKASLAHLVPAGGIVQSSSRTKSMKLSEITKPLSAQVKTKMVTDSIMRMFRSEKILLNLGAHTVRNKLLAKMAAGYPEMMTDCTIAYICEDLRVRLDLAMAWLYELYSTIMGFHPHSNPNSRSFDAYTNLFGRIATTLSVKNELKDRDQLLTRLYLEAPMLPDGGVDFLRRQGAGSSCSDAAINLLKQLVVYRPARQLNYFNALLELSTNNNPEVRTKALSSVLELYDRGEMRQVTQEYARMYLGFLSLKEPPEIVLGENEDQTRTEWTEDLAKCCLFLFMALMEKDHEMLHELTQIFSTAKPDVKRAILKMLDQPVRSMNMESPEVFRLLEDCPEGCETFITKVLHILTDKCPPSHHLIEKVREAYNRRPADVRFLIPVLSSLHKYEVINALPKLVRLNPAVVKEVFSRVLANPVDGLSGPLTPVELLVNLHTIDPIKSDVKSLMKAITICIEDQATFTAEVIAIVINQLIEQPTMPTLLMRTILQALGLHPKLTGFVMNVLQKLLVKQITSQSLFSIPALETRKMELTNANKQITNLFKQCLQRIRQLRFFISDIWPFLARVLVRLSILWVNVGEGNKNVIRSRLQVWKKKVLWEGFIKCCEKTQPQSFSLMLQLAPPQIGDALSMCPGLREPMYNHVMQFPESQRAHIPNSVMMMLYGASVSESLQVKEEPYAYEVKHEVQDHEDMNEVSQLNFKPRSYQYDSELSVPGEEPPGT